MNPCHPVITDLFIFREIVFLVFGYLRLKRSKLHGEKKNAPFVNDLLGGAQRICVPHFWVVSPKNGVDI